MTESNLAARLKRLYARKTEIAFALGIHQTAQEQRRIAGKDAEIWTGKQIGALTDEGAAIDAMFAESLLEVE